MPATRCAMRIIILVVVIAIASIWSTHSNPEHPPEYKVQFCHVPAQGWFLPCSMVDRYEWV